VAKAVIRVAHVLVGSWVLATSVSIVLLVYQRAAAVRAPQAQIAPADAQGFFRSPNGIQAAGRLEGTA
jgi:hypothetical protein